MDHLNPPESKPASRDESAAVDSRTGSPTQCDDSEFTEHERALLAQWDRANMPTPEDSERFQARLRAALAAAADGPVDPRALLDPDLLALSTERARERPMQPASKPRKQR
jgi:hypothetical protein